VFFDAFPISLPLTLERATANLEGAIVLGHGQVTDRAFGVRQIEELHQIAGRARDVRDGRPSMEEAAHAGPYDAETMRIALARGAIELSTT